MLCKIMQRFFRTFFDTFLFAIVGRVDCAYALSNGKAENHCLPLGVICICMCDESMFEL